MTLWKDGLPDRTVWLVIKRTVGAAPSYAYAISNAPVRTPLRTFVWRSGLRWAVAQCFAEGQTELGMDHYEVRKYVGWHHQMLLTLLAHFFLWHLQLKWGKKSPGPHGGTTAVVPRSRVTLADVEDCRRPGGYRLAAAVPSPCLSVPEKTARD